jgi:hypothetical protein
VVALDGGMDTISASLEALPGTLRGAVNFEQMQEGGYQKSGNYEAFDGRTSPSSSTYLVIEPDTIFNPIVVGATATGFSSSATGVVALVVTAYIVVTKVTGIFIAGELLKVGGITVGTIGSIIYGLSQTEDNEAAAAAAAIYRLDIQKVPGSGAVRGVAVLNSAVYAWRDNAGGTALAIYKASASGWTAVPLYYELSFTLGSTQPAEGSTLVQGAVSATIKRVALESGTWGGANAAGRYIITIPSGGSFIAGALTTGGAGTVPGAGAGVYHGTQITLLPGGRIQTDNYTFNGLATTRGIFGCDGINREFELRDDILVPLTTGMGSIRAGAVKAHKAKLILAYGSSLQNSSEGTPYAWSAVTGAAEIATGDTIVCLRTISGSESNAALFVACTHSIFVLYGNSSSSWSLRPYSSSRGCVKYSDQDSGKTLVLDTDGFVDYTPTQEYGNFATELVSLKVSPLVRERQVYASVFVKALGRYRCFFTDGTIITGTQMRTKDGFYYSWMPQQLPITVNVAVSEEVSGIQRTFYGDTEGYVYEADKGRSANGESIYCALKLSCLHQKAPFIEKTYRGCYVEGSSSGPFSISVAAVFDEDQPNTEALRQELDIDMHGVGGVYDLTTYDASYYDIGERDRRLFDIEGMGCSVSPIIFSDSAVQLTFKLRFLAILYNMRKLTR